MNSNIYVVGFGEPYVKHVKESYFQKGSWVQYHKTRSLASASCLCWWPFHRQYKNTLHSLTYWLPKTTWGRGAILPGNGTVFENPESCQDHKTGSEPRPAVCAVHRKLAQFLVAVLAGEAHQHPSLMLTPCLSCHGAPGAYSEALGSNEGNSSGQSSTATQTSPSSPSPQRCLTH